VTAWIPELARLLDAGKPVVMVTIVASQGSAPREVGARMLVHEAGFAFTVGGGRLEFETLAVARESLAQGADAAVRSFILGPDLGQCCGGAATMLFEPFSPADAAWVGKLAAAIAEPAPVVRYARIDADGRFSRRYMIADEAEPGLRERVERALASANGIAAELSGEACEFVEVLRDTRQPLWLFGAGHVGRAIARAFAPLPFRLVWVDAREDGFPPDIPAGVRTLRALMPQYLVDEAPPGAMFLVMTHSHALDEDVCEAVLRRGDFAYLGLIGSGTKRARIRARLRAKGIGEDTLERMISPIGLPGLGGKEPAVIAASVAADLLVRLEQRRAGAASGANGDRIDV
jgi:xanthine dehydrogenase accessory factor